VFCFTDVEIIAVPAAGFVNYFRFLRTIQAVLVWKERFDAAIILLPYLGLQSNQISQRLKSCVYNFYSFVNLKIIFQNNCRIKSFFPYKDRLNHSQKSKVFIFQLGGLGSFNRDFATFCF